MGSNSSNKKHASCKAGCGTCILVWSSVLALCSIWSNEYAYENSALDYLCSFSIALLLFNRDKCIFAPTWNLPTGFALTFLLCSVLPLDCPPRSLECPLTVWPILWKFITNWYELRKMQIRYQNVQINIIFMGISFAFRTKANYPR